MKTNILVFGIIVIVFIFFVFKFHNTSTENTWKLTNDDRVAIERWAKLRNNKPENTPTFAEMYSLGYN